MLRGLGEALVSPHLNQDRAINASSHPPATTLPPVWLTRPLPARLILAAPALATPLRPARVPDHQDHEGPHRGRHHLILATWGVTCPQAVTGPWIICVRLPVPRARQEPRMPNRPDLAGRRAHAHACAARRYAPATVVRGPGLLTRGPRVGTTGEGRHWTVAVPSTDFDPHVIATPKPCLNGPSVPHPGVGSRPDRHASPSVLHARWPP